MSVHRIGLILLIILPLWLFSQSVPEENILAINGRIKIEKGAKEGVVVTLMKDSMVISTVQDVANFRFDLSLGSRYTIIIKKDKYCTVEYIVDSTCKDDDKKYHLDVVAKLYNPNARLKKIGELTRSKIVEYDVHYDAEKKSFVVEHKESDPQTSGGK